MVLSLFSSLKIVWMNHAHSHTHTHTHTNIPLHMHANIYPCKHQLRHYTLIFYMPTHILQTSMYTCKHPYTLHSHINTHMQAPAHTHTLETVYCKRQHGVNQNKCTRSFKQNLWDVTKLITVYVQDLSLQSNLIPSVSPHHKLQFKCHKLTGNSFCKVGTQTYKSKIH